MSSYLDRIVKMGRRYVKQGTPMKYLTSRGVSVDQIDSLSIGYIPEDTWPPYIDVEKEGEDAAHYWKQSGHGVKLKGKLIFPLTNALGQIKAFQVRTPNSKTKDYWKFYSLSADIDALFFGTNVAMEHIWERSEVCLVEGIFDLPPVLRAYPNTLCMGTATINPNQLTFLKRYVKRIKVMTDNDEQGRRFFSKFYKDYSSCFEQIVKVPYSGSDPSDSWSRLGEDKFKRQLSSEFLMNLSTSLSGRTGIV